MSYSLVRRRAVVLLAVSIVAAALAISCGDGEQEATVVKEAQPSPTLVAAPTDVRQTDIAPTQTIPSSPPSLTPITTEIIPTTTPTATSSPAPSAVPPTLYPTPDFPPPTRHAGGTSWVEERLNAVISLYKPTPAGKALLRSLDLRQMKGEPGYFGSYGFEGWAGIGEAKPLPTMHELMHSYWGGFPVIGLTDLGWEKNEGETVSPGLASYHADILTFMGQPPDDYEVLRQRFRNLPGLSAENTEPLLHNLEADLPQTTGGDLGLVPPILRKYWGYFLDDGPFGNWDQAMRWLQSLPHEERRVAGRFLGFEHLDLRQYTGLPAYVLPADYLADAERVLETEERQRLSDLAEQFDLLLGDAQLEENFQFWRGYLQDKERVHRSHPEYLRSLGTPRASEIADALQFINEMEGTPRERAAALEQRIPEQPFLVNFLPAVDNRTLVELFAKEPEIPEAPTLQATASFVERLQRFASLAEEVLDAGRNSPSDGAGAMYEFLDETGLEREQDLRLFFDLFHDAEPNVAHRVMAEVDKATVRELMARVPVQLRNLLRPERLLEKLDITPEAAEEDLIRGIRLLIEEPSGNYRIDEPFLHHLYQVMARRAQMSSTGALRTMMETPFPLEGMIVNMPAAAGAALRADIELAVALVEGSDQVVAPPARIVYRLIGANPAVAALIVIELEKRGRDEVVVESLAYFAYDKVRSERYPLLGISLGRNGDFLETLLQFQGEEWLRSRLMAAVELYRERVARGEVAHDFPDRYRETLEASVETVGAPQDTVLKAVVAYAFE